MAVTASQRSVTTNWPMPVLPRAQFPRAKILPFPTNAPTDYARQRVGCELSRVQPLLRRYAASLTRSAVEADDLVQEACLRALSRAELWDPSRRFESWICRLLRNLWLSERRRYAVREGQGQVPAEEALAEPYDAEAHALGMSLRRAIAELPDELRDVLLLTAIEGFGHREAAEKLGIPAGTVMSRLHRARQMLRDRIEESGA